MRPKLPPDAQGLRTDEMAYVHPSLRFPSPLRFDKDPISFLQPGPRSGLGMDQDFFQIRQRESPGLYASKHFRYGNLSADLLMGSLWLTVFPKAEQFLKNDMESDMAIVF